MGDEGGWGALGAAGAVMGGRGPLGTCAGLWAVHLGARWALRRWAVPSGTLSGTDVHGACTKAVSTVFCAAVLPAVGMCLGGEREGREALWGDDLFGTSPWSRWMVDVAVGYFMWELSEVVVHYKEEGPLWVFHALYSLVTFALSAGFEFMHFYCALILTWEVPTVLLNLRWVLYKTGRGQGRLFDAVQAAFFFAFFLARVVPGPLQLYWALSSVARLVAQGSGAGHPDIDGWMIGIYVFGNVSAQAVNLYWFAKMVKIAFPGRPRTQAIHPRPAPDAASDAHAAESQPPVRKRRTSADRHPWVVAAES